MMRLSLKDRYFYPLALGVIAGMIAFALSFANFEKLSDTTIRAEGYTLEGEELTKLTASPATQYDFVGQTPNDPAYARLYSVVARDVAPPSPGVFAPLGPDYERAFAEHTLRITVTARSSRTRGLDTFDMGYFTAGAGDSPWVRHTLTDEWAEYAMEFKPGLPVAEPDLDYFAIWPGVTNEPLGMDVRQMRVDVIGN